MWRAYLIKCNLNERLVKKPKEAFSGKTRGWGLESLRWHYFSYVISGVLLEVSCRNFGEPGSREGTRCEGGSARCPLSSVGVGPHTLVAYTQTRFDLQKHGSGASSLPLTPLHANQCLFSFQPAGNFNGHEGDWCLGFMGDVVHGVPSTQLSGLSLAARFIPVVTGRFG